MKNYTKEELIKILKDYYQKIGRTPKMREVAYNQDLPPIHQFLKNFGSWNNALKESNIEIIKIGIFSKEELLNALKKEAEKLGRSLKIEDFEKNKTLPSPMCYFKHFGSWNNALREAGLKINVRKKYTNEELLELLKKKAKELGRSPISDDLNNDPNMPDRSTYDEHFGTMNNALRLAGLEVRYQFRKWTKEEAIKWLQYKYDELGKPPGIRDFDKDPRAPAKNTIRKLFGNWTNALREANIPVKRFRSKKELITILQKLALKLNRTPNREELKKMKGYPSPTPFIEQFGSYTAACLSAGLTPNDGRNNNIWKSWQRHCEDIARVVYRDIEIQKEGAVEGIPDIYVPDEKLFIDAKTCGYRDFKEQIKRYCKNNNRLEFWLIFKGIETKRKRVKYIYAEELAKKMVKLGRKDLAVKCHQFIRNVYDERQRILE